jgi:lipopolysaccharide export system protein LptC
MNSTITARTDPKTAHAYWTMSRGDSERTFRAARRHSRVVRLLRISIPVGVVLVCAGLFLVAYFNPLRMIGKLPIDISNLVVAGSKITMEHPRLSGFTHDARAYELSADAAKQDLTKPDLIELRNLRAKVEMQDKTSIQMSAVTGLYDSKSETLKLDQNIELSSSTGYSGYLSEATVDIRKGYVVSEHPVELHLLQGKLTANRLEIINSGDLVRFDRGVNMQLMLSNADKTGVR